MEVHVHGYGGAGSAHGGSSSLESSKKYTASPRITGHVRTGSDSIGKAKKSSQELVHIKKNLRIGMDTPSDGSPPVSPERTLRLSSEISHKRRPTPNESKSPRDLLQILFPENEVQKFELQIPKYLEKVHNSVSRISVISSGCIACHFKKASNILILQMDSDKKFKECLVPSVIEEDIHQILIKFPHFFIIRSTSTSLAITRVSLSSPFFSAPTPPVTLHESNHPNILSVLSGANGIFLLYLDNILYLDHAYTANSPSDLQSTSIPLEKAIPFKTLHPELTRVRNESVLLVNSNARELALLDLKKGTFRLAPSEKTTFEQQFSLLDYNEDYVIGINLGLIILIHIETGQVHEITPAGKPSCLCLGSSFVLLGFIDGSIGKVMFSDMKIGYLLTTSTQKEGPITLMNLESCIYSIFLLEDAFFIACKQTVAFVGNSENGEVYNTIKWKGIGRNFSVYSALNIKKKEEEEIKTPKNLEKLSESKEGLPMSDESDDDESADNDTPTKSHKVKHSSKEMDHKNMVMPMRRIKKIPIGRKSCEDLTTGPVDIPKRIHTKSTTSDTLHLRRRRKSSASNSKNLTAPDLSERVMKAKEEEPMIFPPTQLEIDSDNEEEDSRDKRRIGRKSVEKKNNFITGRRRIPVEDIEKNSPDDEDFSPSTRQFFRKTPVKRYSNKSRERRGSKEMTDKISLYFRVSNEQDLETLYSWTPNMRKIKKEKQKGLQKLHIKSNPRKSTEKRRALIVNPTKSIPAPREEVSPIKKSFSQNTRPSRIRRSISEVRASIPSGIDKAYSNSVYPGIKIEEVYKQDLGCILRGMRLMNNVCEYHLPDISPVEINELDDFVRDELKFVYFAVYLKKEDLLEYLYLMADIYDFMVCTYPSLSIAKSVASWICKRWCGPHSTISNLKKFYEYLEDSFNNATLENINMSCNILHQQVGRRLNDHIPLFLEWLQEREARLSPSNFLLPSELIVNVESKFDEILNEKALFTSFEKYLKALNSSQWLHFYSKYSKFAKILTNDNFKEETSEMIRNYFSDDIPTEQKVYLAESGHLEHLMMITEQYAPNNFSIVFLYFDHILRDVSLYLRRHFWEYSWILKSNMDFVKGFDLVFENWDEKWKLIFEELKLLNCYQMCIKIHKLYQENKKNSNTAYQDIEKDFRESWSELGKFKYIKFYVDRLKYMIDKNVYSNEMYYLLFLQLKKCLLMTFVDYKIKML